MSRRTRRTANNNLKTVSLKFKDGREETGLFRGKSASGKSIGVFNQDGKLQWIKLTTLENYEVAK